MNIIDYIATIKHTQSVNINIPTGFSALTQMSQKQLEQKMSYITTAHSEPNCSEKKDLISSLPLSFGGNAGMYSSSSQQSRGGLFRTLLDECK